jgi:hypothetical protein
MNFRAFATITCKDSASYGGSNGERMWKRMGEADQGALRFDFDYPLLLRFRGSTITADAGPLFYPELDDTLL